MHQCITVATRVYMHVRRVRCLAARLLNFKHMGRSLGRWLAVAAAALHCVCISHWRRQSSANNFHATQRRCMAWLVGWVAGWLAACLSHFTFCVCISLKISTNAVDCGKCGKCVVIISEVKKNGDSSGWQYLERRCYRLLRNNSVRVWNSRGVVEYLIWRRIDSRWSDWWLRMF